MARARNIKPSFFTNEKLAELPYEARLMFVGLWTLADRAGRLEDRPKRIKMSLFPADDIDTVSVLNMLEKSGFIFRYEIKTEPYIQIVNFVKHQNPHVKEKASRIPAPDSHRASPSESLNLIPESPIPDEQQLLDPSPEGEIPPGLDLTAWQRWIDYRKKIRKPLKQVSILAAQQELAAFGDDQAAVVQKSIANGYQGLFPLKNGGPNGTHQRTDNSAAGRVRAANNIRR